MSDSILDDLNPMNRTAGSPAPVSARDEAGDSILNDLNPMNRAARTPVEVPEAHPVNPNAPIMAKISAGIGGGAADLVGGLAETFAKGVTTAAGDIAGGAAAWAGELLPGGDWERAQRWGDAVQKQVSTVGGALGEPETQTGQAIQHVLAPVGEWIGKARQYIGGTVANATGSPMLGAITDAAPQALGDYLMLRGAVNQAASMGKTPPEVVAPTTAAERSGAASPSGKPTSVDAAVQTVRDGGMPPAAAMADAQATLGRHAQAANLPVPIQLTKGQATLDPVQISREQNARGASQQFAGAFDRQSQQLKANLDAIQQVAAPAVADADHIASGQSLIDTYKAKDAALNDTIRTQYKALEDANGGSLPLDGGSFVSSAEAALKQKMKGAFLPPEIQSVMSDIKDGGQMSMEQFENLRTTLASASRTAERAGDGNRVAAIRTVRDQLENMPIPEGASAQVKALADQARASAKSRFDLMDNDPAYKAAVSDSVAPDDFVNKFVVRGKKGDLATMQANLADNPQAAQVIASSAINYLRQRSGIVGNNGNFSAAGYNKAMFELNPKLGQLFADPAIAEKLTDLGDVAHYTTFQPRGSFVNNSNTLTALGGHLAEHGANAVAGYPVASWVKSMTQGFRNRQLLNESFAPNAGVSAQMMQALEAQKAAAK